MDNMQDLQHRQAELTRQLCNWMLKNLMSALINSDLEFETMQFKDDGDYFVELRFGAISTFKLQLIPSWHNSTPPDAKEVT